MLVLTADQMVRLTVSYPDRYGNPATIDGVPRWESSDPGIITVTPGADGSFADAVTVGPAGIVQVRAIVDAVLGAEERLIIGVQEIQVIGGEARVVSLSAGAVLVKDQPSLLTDPVAAAAPPAESAPQQAAEPAPQPTPAPAAQPAPAPAPEPTPAPAPEPATPDASQG